MIKKAVARVQALILLKKWNMNAAGAGLLGEVFRQDYKKHKGEFLKVYSIHRQGYSWDDWHVNELTKESCATNFRTAQYYAMHPLNGRYSHWIDDRD